MNKKILSFLVKLCKKIQPSIDNATTKVRIQFNTIWIVEKPEAYGLKKLASLKKYIYTTSTKFEGTSTHVFGRSWIIIPILTILVKKSILGIPLKLVSINE